MKPLALVVALAVVAYVNALRNGFVLDDVPVIVESPLVRDVGNIGTIFRSNYWARGGSGVVGDSTLYRPLTVFTYAVDFSFWGLDATAFHAVNVVLHAATTVALFLLAVELFGSVVVAFAAGAIFAVHPIHTEAVTGIVGRAEVLATLFFLAAFLTLRIRPRAATASSTLRSRWPSLGMAAGGAMLYLLGMFSKETAVTLPAVLALDDWLRRGETARTENASGESPAGRPGTLPLMVARYGALACALAIYLAFRTQAVSGGSQIWPGFVGVSAGDRILTASRVALEYVGLFVFPRTLRADYWKGDVPIATSIGEPLVLMSLLAWAAVAVFAFRRRHDPPLVLALGWFFVTLGPVSNVLFPIGVAKAERLLYLPSVGLCLVAGWAYWRAERVVRSLWLPRVALAGVLATFGARTMIRNVEWRDNLTLALVTLSASPSSPLMNDIAAGEYFRRGDARRAVELLRVAVRSAPDMALLRTHLGAAYHSQGLLDEAIAEYREAIRTTPNDASARNNLGVAYRDKGREADAVGEFLEATRINPGYADPHINLGSVHLEHGRLRDAEAAFSSAVRADPLSADAHNALGVAYGRLGQPDRAADQYREALRLAPGHAAARANLERLSTPLPARP